MMKKLLFILTVGSMMIGCYPNDERFRPDRIEFKELGTWDANGVPNYLCERGSAIEPDLLNRFNAALVSRENAITNHPEWFADTLETDDNLRILQNTDMTITFLNEEASNSNIFGYYLYPTNNAPNNPNDIDNYFILFPNIRKSTPEQANLVLGDKICINDVAAGSTLGFFVVIQGWRDNQISITEGQRFGFTDFRFNENYIAEGERSKKSLLLYDETTGKYIITFEALFGPQTDNDYEDAAVIVEFSNPNAVDAAGIIRLP